MPSELRIIRFKLDEVAIALRDFASRIGLDMPDGELTSAAHVTGQEIPCTSFALKGGGDELSISNSHLAASLIHYCITGGVPLPRAGNKEISVSSKFIDLKVGMGHRTLDCDVSEPVALDV
ncbi:MAG: hypothetical protein ACE5FM_09365 [Methyloligellaceae bacterium]